MSRRSPPPRAPLRLSPPMSPSSPGFRSLGVVGVPLKGSIRRSISGSIRGFIGF